MGSVFGLSFVELYAIKKTQFHEAYDISKAKNEIGYCPSVTLEEGMKSTIDWVRKTSFGGKVDAKRRVVITGMGVIAPNGIGIDNFWDTLLHGRSGVAK